MPVSRRGFLRFIGAAEEAAVDGAFLSARGLEDELAWAQTQGPRAPRPTFAPGVEAIRISSNENPLGPGKAALDAILGRFPEAGRYRSTARRPMPRSFRRLPNAIKRSARTSSWGAGSQDILKSACARLGPRRPRARHGAAHLREPDELREPAQAAVTEVKVDSAMRLDVEGMIAAASKGGRRARLLQQPNNPRRPSTARRPSRHVERIRKASPNTVILIDEAYHEYVTTRRISTAIPLALSTPNVSWRARSHKRTGMAGMRIGYAIGCPTR